jgi:hypothetical protein
MAFGRKNTKKNPNDKQTTPVSDPKRLLKPKGYLRHTTASASKVYQPRITQDNVKVHTEELTPKESFKQIHFVEASTSKPEVKIKTPEAIIPEIKVEIDPTDTFNSEDKGSPSIPIVINTLPILSFPEVKVYVSQNPEEYFIYPYSSPIDTPLCTYGKPEEPSSSFHFPPHIDLSYPHDPFPKLHSSHPKVVERLAVQSLEVFENPFSSP